MKNKIKSFFGKKSVKKFVSICCAVVIMAMSCVTCFAADGTTISGDTIDGIKSAVSGIFTQITSVFSFTNLLQFIAIGIVAAATIVLGFIGLRKLVSMITNALKARFKTV